MLKKQRHETEHAKYAKRKGLKWLSDVANPFHQGEAADKRCNKCGHWLYAEGLNHSCMESRARGR